MVSTFRKGINAPKEASKALGGLDAKPFKSAAPDDGVCRPAEAEALSPARGAAANAGGIQLLEWREH
jgi:hypothetical protein